MRVEDTSQHVVLKKGWTERRGRLYVVKLMKKRVNKDEEREDRGTGADSQLF